MNRQIIQGDALEKLKEIDDNSIDLLCSDFPYGYSFMNKSWDKALVDIPTLKECLRVLKPGSWAFVMCAPRQDVLSHMIVNLSDAGFKTNFTSIYWAYSTGFPKAANTSKLVDKRGGRIGHNTKTIKEKIKNYFKKSALTLSEFNQKCGFEASGYLRKSSTWQSVLPSSNK